MTNDNEVGYSGVRIVTIVPGRIPRRPIAIGTFNTFVAHVSFVFHNPGFIILVV